MNRKPTTRRAVLAAAAVWGAPLLAALSLTGGAYAGPPALNPKPGSGGGPPPPYTNVRSDEDYVSLRDPAARKDPFDPIKYIPLNEGGDWYLSLGGQARYRYEYFNNSNFGAGVQDTDGYHLIRFMAHADLHLGRNLRVFVQGKSALIEDGGIGPDGGPRQSDADEVDVQQLFVDVRAPLGGAADDGLTLRVGRQDLIYGAQRLIAPADWGNVRRTFEGAKLSVATGPNALDLFWVRPVDIDAEEPNVGDQTTSFAGVYDTLALPDLLAAGDNSKLEVYGLLLNRTSTRFATNASAASPALDEDRYTVGARFFTNPKPWDVDVEGAYQFGQVGDGRASAWMFAADAGYTVAAAPLSPRVSLGFDIASGDNDPADPDVQTFNQLFPLGHAYYGFVDVVGRQNAIDLHPGLQLTLLKDRPAAKKLTLRADYHVFWRESERDALYGAGAGAGTSGAGVQRAAGGSRSAYVGSELDLLLNWQIDRHTAAYVGYSRFFAGDFIADTGAAAGTDQDVDFVYAALTYTF